MSRLVFAHDHKFIISAGRVHSTSGGLNDAVLSRYTEIADEVIVLARSVESDVDPDPHLEITTPGLVVLNAPDQDDDAVEGLLRDADFIVVRLPSIVGLRVARAARRLRRLYLVEVVGSAAHALWYHSLKGKIAAPFMDYAVKRAVAGAPYVLYVTTEFLQDRYPTSGRAIGVSDVDCEAASQDRVEARVRRIRNRDGSPITIGTCAAVDVRYKGQDHVLRALGMLRREGVGEFRYQLVGAGNPDRLKSVARAAGVSDWLDVLGPLPHSAVFDWLDGIDVYVQPSHQEGLPRALVEAMGRGLPCLGSPVGGIPELLDSRQVYRRSGRPEDQISRWLGSLDAQLMESLARRNFGVAQDYAPDLLRARRSAFLRVYSDACLGESGEV